MRSEKEKETEREGELTSKTPPLPLMHLPLSEPQPPDPDDIGNQLDKERRLLERIGLLVQDLLVRLETSDQHGVRVAHVEVADQVGAGPFLHP